MAEFPQSREEAILQATINGEEYTGYPESRIEELLLELKAVIEGGGGGGGTTNYNLLENKPQIGGVTLTGDKSASDLSLASTSRLADAENMVCAEFFDASKAYTKDAYVIYNDGLYKFKSAHTAGAAWDAAIVDEVDLLTVIQEATNPTIVPPVLNKESVVSENDANTLSANFTAQQTSSYILILSICNSESLPTLTSCNVSVNSVAKETSDYFVSQGYGINSKYALLNLEAGDTISASLASNVDNYGTSASIMLVRLSSSINGLTLKESAFANNYVDPTISFNVEKSGLYLLWFFSRGNGVGTFKTIKQNNVNITKNKIVCSSGNGWQISHGMCIAAAEPSDIFALSIQFNGYFDAVGIFEVLADTGESYNDLKDKPQIGGVTLSGNKSASDLGLASASDLNGKVSKSVVATEFDESVTYVAGKYVIYQNQFYRCLQYCSGPWDPSHFTLVDISSELFNAASFNKFYGSANYDGFPDYKIDHSYVHQGSSNIPPYPSDGKAGTTNRFGILKTTKMDTGYIFQTLIVSYEGEPSGDNPTIKTKFYYRSAIRINGTYVWGNWYEITGTEIV